MHAFDSCVPIVPSLPPPVPRGLEAAGRHRGGGRHAGPARGAHLPPPEGGPREPSGRTPAPRWEGLLVPPSHILVIFLIIQNSKKYYRSDRPLVELVESGWFQIPNMKAGHPFPPVAPPLSAPDRPPLHHGHGAARPPTPLGSLLQPAEPPGGLFLCILFGCVPVYFCVGEGNSMLSPPIWVWDPCSPRFLTGPHGRLRSVRCRSPPP